MWHILHFCQDAFSTSQTLQLMNNMNYNLFDDLFGILVLHDKHFCKLVVQKFSKKLVKGLKGSRFFCRIGFYKQE